MTDETPSRDNIEVFNLVAGMILADLYADFPVSKTLGSFDVAMKAGLVPDTSDMSGEEDAAVKACIHWLIDEGFVRAGSVHTSGMHASKCVLTAKGLRLLSVPSVLDPKESFGEGLKKSLKAGLNEGVKQSVGLLVKTAFATGGAWVAQHVPK